MAEPLPGGPSLYLERKRQILDRLGAEDGSWSDWTWHIAQRATSMEGLRDKFGVELEGAPALEEVLTRYALGVTPHYAALAAGKIGEDPVWAQALPDSRELSNPENLPEDPFREAELSPVPGLIHRHRETALLLVGHFCPVYCRHCFRKRHFQDSGGFLKGPALDKALDYIRRTPQIRDVLISGGEPLVAGDDYLADLLGKLRAIPALDLIRIGTRNPVTLPQRFTPDLVNLFGSLGPLSLVTHFNHPAEFNPDSDRALKALRLAGVGLYNQAVLLKGVNDDLETQVELQYGLLRRGVKPYYLHHADLVAGAGHFRTSLREGLDLAAALRARVSGMAFPWYVLDAPGGHGKVPLLGQVEAGEEGRYRIQAPDGQWFDYRDPL